MSRPRVSVLLPVRDEEPYLAECLDSLSAQTLADIEVIAVDDGSTDATPAILERHARGDSRVRVLCQEPAGMVAASERARAEAWAPLVARMDADDVALPERFELQAAAIEEEGSRPWRPVEYLPDPTDGPRAYPAAWAWPDRAGRAPLVPRPGPAGGLRLMLRIWKAAAASATWTRSSTAGATIWNGSPARRRRRRWTRSGAARCTFSAGRCSPTDGPPSSGEPGRPGKRWRGGCSALGRPSPPSSRAKASPPPLDKRAVLYL